DSVHRAGQHVERPGRWVEEVSWPSPNVEDRQLSLNEGSLGIAPEQGTAMSICSPQSFGSAGGDMCSFAIPGDMPTDCRIDAAGALPCRTAPLNENLGMLGQPKIARTATADRRPAFVPALLG